jgi:hypothetical protein
MEAADAGWRRRRGIICFAFGINISGKQGRQIYVSNFV